MQKPTQFHKIEIEIEMFWKIPITYQKKKIEKKRNLNRNESQFVPFFLSLFLSTLTEPRPQCWAAEGQSPGAGPGPAERRSCRDSRRRSSRIRSRHRRCWSRHGRRRSSSYSPVCRQWSPHHGAPNGCLCCRSSCRRSWNRRSCWHRSSRYCIGTGKQRHSPSG